MGSADYLSTFIDLSRIVELSINIDLGSEHLSTTITTITSLLEQMSNLRCLIFDGTFTSAENICLLVPNHVKHLQISVMDVHDVKLVIERLTHLSTIMFTCADKWKSVSPEFETWLAEKGSQGRYRNDNVPLSIWLNKTSNSEI